MVRSRGMAAVMRGDCASMSRISVAERLRLSVFAGRGVLPRIGNRIPGLSLIRVPFLRGAIDRLVIAPQDLRTSDATRGSEIYSGRFSFAGKVVICDTRSPFQIAPPSEEWAAGV